MIRHKKITILLCVFLTALNLVACGQVKEDKTVSVDEVATNQQENSTRTVESTVSDIQEAASDKTDIYDCVLAEYSYMVQNDFYINLRDSDWNAYENSFGEHIGYAVRNYKQDIFYAFYDIDGNGTVELIIAGEGKGYYDLYGYDGTNVVHIFPEMDFGYKTSFSLCENGVIKVLYTDSATTSGVDFYKIGNDGFTPELVDAFVTVAMLEGENAVLTYSQNGTEISEEEYNANINSYGDILASSLDWIQIHY